MSATAEVQGVVLSFVTRVVKGAIPRTLTEYDEETKELAHKEVAIKEPVLVFFPNGTSQVLSSDQAEKKGFLGSPEIINFVSVTDAKTPAGRYKFAIRDKDRHDAWLEMEDNIIRHVLSKSGNPLPEGVTYERTSILFN